MKTHRLLFLSKFSFIFLCIVTSCENKPAESRAHVWHPERQYISYPTDTVNFTDQNKLKQGVWYNFDKNGKTKDTIVYYNDTAYPVTRATIREVIDKLNKMP